MIRLKDVEMEYPNGTRAIRGISAAIEDGEFVFLVGPPGPENLPLSKCSPERRSPQQAVL